PPACFFTAKRNRPEACATFSLVSRHGPSYRAFLPAPTAPTLARRLGLFDATMIVMGGIVGSGIFINPYVVARQVHTPFLILGAWIFGGVVGVGGAFL